MKGGIGDKRKNAFIALKIIENGLKLQSLTVTDVAVFEYSQPDFCAKDVENNIAAESVQEIILFFIKTSPFLKYNMKV